MTGSAIEMTGPRRRLIEALRAQGISDLAVLRAFDLTPRHRFVPSGVAHRAYEDAPLPIGSGQTISQPLVHARTLQALRLTPSDRVLEIGTGSGFQTVLLSHLAGQVFSVERVPALMARAREAIAAAGVRNVSLLEGDGTLGWPAHAPYDAIAVGAGAPIVPEPLRAQLADGGRLVVPVGPEGTQSLRLILRTGDTFEEQDLGPVRFVPLLGEHGWAG